MVINGKINILPLKMVMIQATVLSFELYFSCALYLFCYR